MSANAYGCLIPHLTRFTRVHRARTDYQHHLADTLPSQKTLKKDITLAIADCKYRAPLLPRPYDFYIILHNKQYFNTKIYFFCFFEKTYRKDKYGGGFMGIFPST